VILSEEETLNEVFFDLQKLIVQNVQNIMTMCYTSILQNKKGFTNSFLVIFKSKLILGIFQKQRTRLKQRL